MKEHLLYITYLSKISLSIQSLFSNPTGLMLLIPSISIALLTNLQLLLLMMLSAFIFDFITGIYASYIEKKQSNDKVKVYWIESAKLRRSVVKATSYMLFIAGVFVFEKLFFIKQLKFTSISEKEFTITTIAVAFCFAIEFFSILENLKRSGFDLLGQFKSGAKKVHGLIKTAKGDDENI